MPNQARTVARVNVRVPDKSREKAALLAALPRLMVALLRVQSAPV